MQPNKSQRHERILANLSYSPSLRIAELAAGFGVSTETIRRDLDELTRQGRLSRTYGGAVRALGSEPAVAERNTQRIAERERIARATLPLIEGARVVMMGSGTSTMHVARAMAAGPGGMTVITHALGIAGALSRSASIATLIAPGSYDAPEDCTLGAHTVAFIGGFSAEIAVLGASGLTEEGPTDAMIESAAIYAAMLRRAARTIIVADHTKFGRVFPARWAGWREIDALVCDAAPEGDLAAELDRRDVRVVVAGT